jgi:OHCU decarboxylase
MSWLNGFNVAPPEDAALALVAACASPGWAKAVVKRRPFASANLLLLAAEQEWWKQPQAEWLHAFAAHPRIGESAAAKPQHGAGNLWSSQEQRGASESSDTVKTQLAEINRAYEAKFGYTYIVSATGKTGEELLRIAQERLAHAPESELRIAATEQVAIMRLRLKRLLAIDPEKAGPA